MIRILEVLPTLKRAGAENMVVSLARNLDRDRFVPALVSLYDASANGLESQLAGIRVWHLAKRKGFDWRIYSRLRQVMREFKPDVVHTHSYVMRYTLPIWHGPAVHTVHNLARREVDGLGRLIHRLGWRLGAAPVAVARSVATSFADEYGFAPAAIIGNGIDLAKYQVPLPTRTEWRQANGFSDEDLLIVSVARLEPQKNPVMLADAFAEASLPRAHLLFAGDGSLRRLVEGRPGVHVLGVRTDIPDLLAAADLFALASGWEGYPLAVVEALAAGLPVVACAVGGVPEIVEDGRSGLLISAGDTPAFAGALRALGQDAARRRSMSDAARQRAMCFGVNRMVEEYEMLFERIVGISV